MSTRRARRSARLKCEQCGDRFTHHGQRGPRPKFCTPACRQAAFRVRHGVRDPETAEEWQEAVDGAQMMLLIDSAVLYGLIETGMVINVRRCDELLEEGRQRGYEPRPIDELIAEWFAA